MSASQAQKKKNIIILIVVKKKFKLLLNSKNKKQNKTKQNLPFLTLKKKKKNCPFLFSSPVLKVGKQWGIEALQHLLSSSTTSASDNPLRKKSWRLLCSLPTGPFNKFERDFESETAFQFHWRFDQFEILDWGFVPSLFLPWIVFLDFRVSPETVSLKLRSSLPNNNKYKKNLVSYHILK